MKNTEEVPSRTLPPIIISYCSFTQSDFTQFINRVMDVLKDEYGNTFNLEIDHNTFDTPFTSPELLTNALTKVEWKDMKTLVIRYFVGKDKYRPVVEISLGKTLKENYKVGFYCVIKSGKTSQKLAIKENIKLLMNDYTRRPLNAFFSAIICGTVFLVLYIAFAAILRYRFQYGNLLDKDKGYWIFVFLAPFIASAVQYSNVIPSVEFLNESGKTRWKVCSNYLYSFIAVAGLALTIVALI